MIKNQTFDQAMKALVAGKIVKREPWAEGNFLFMHNRFRILEIGIEGFQVFPENVRAKLLERQTPVFYTSHISVVSPDNYIFSWTINFNDAFANDWVIEEDDLPSNKESSTNSS